MWFLTWYIYIECDYDYGMAWSICDEYDYGMEWLGIYIMIVRSMIMVLDMNKYMYIYINIFMNISLDYDYMIKCWTWCLYPGLGVVKFLCEIMYSGCGVDIMWWYCMLEHTHVHYMKTVLTEKLVFVQ